MQWGCMGIPSPQKDLYFAKIMSPTNLKYKNFPKEGTMTPLCFPNS